MKKSIFKIGAFLMVATFVSASVFTGCKKDHGPTPEIPAANTLAMDFETFPKETQRSDPDSTKSNFTFAATNVAVWNVILTVTLVVPVAAFKEAFNHEAEYDTDEDKWAWKYDVMSNGIKYSAKLLGKIDGDNVNWEMYVSQENGFQDFLWYTGVSATDKTHGTWTLNKDPQNSSAFLSIDWNKNSDGTADIKYTNIVPGSADNGGYIYYGITNNTDFNAFYDIYNKGQDNTTNITWNKGTKVGKVKDPKHFLNADWQCWDATLTNATCN